MKLNFYVCKHCGNIITTVKESGVPVSCCGEPMQPLVAGSVDAAKEKHVAVLTVNGSDVSVAVGSVTHPMTPEHFIEWVAIETSNSTQIRYLSIDEPPMASFHLTDGETLQTVYAYCNLHGLWKSTL